VEVFICYPNAAKARAAQVAAKLRSQGHRVFLDQDSLPSGQDYDQRIRNAVNSCDVFLFFITPESIGAGKYTLTELGYAKKRWPNPTGRVLPVMVESTAFDLIDPYLTESVTVLQTKGNFATEVMNALQEHLQSPHALPNKSNRRRRRIFMGAGLAVCSALVGLYWAVSETRQPQIGSAISTSPDGDSARPTSERKGPSKEISPTESSDTRQAQEDKPREARLKPRARRSAQPGKSKTSPEKAEKPRDTDIPDQTCVYLCGEAGRCTHTAVHRDGWLPCIATSEQDCQRARRCSQYGECGLNKESYNCRPTTNEHCRSSASCKTSGKCSLAGKRCIAQEAEDCLNSVACDDHGDCSVTKEGSCGALSDADCRRSRKCKERGACYLSEGSRCTGGPDPQQPMVDDEHHKYVPP
jgi:hypothetical protein